MKAVIVGANRHRWLESWSHMVRMHRCSCGFGMMYVRIESNTSLVMKFSGTWQLIFDPATTWNSLSSIQRIGPSFALPDLGYKQQANQHRHANKHFDVK